MAAEKKAVNLEDPKSLNIAEGGAAHRNPSRKGKQVEYEGKNYPSIKAVAEAYNTSADHAAKWIKGTTVRNGYTRTPITVEGIEYESIAEAARATGYTAKTVAKFRDPNYSKKKKDTAPVMVLGVLYETTGKAGEAHNITAPTVRYRCLAKTRKFKDWYYT